MLTEQRPRMQSRAEVVPLRQGEGVVFAVQPSAGAGRAGGVSGDDAAWGEPGAVGEAAYAGGDFHDAA